MSEIHAIGLSEVDTEARLVVEKSMTDGYAVALLGFGPVKTGFGLRLHVPLGTEQMEEADDPGSFLELTYGQALDLNAKLAARLAELNGEKEI